MIKHHMTPKIKLNRVQVLLFLFTLIFLLLIIRTGYIQIIWGDELRNQAFEQWVRESQVFPERGDILDRNGELLATSASTVSIAASPVLISNAEAVADKLSHILDLDKNLLYKKISDRSKGHVWIKRQVNKLVADEIMQLDIAGISFTDEPRRFYPNKDLAAHILGFTKRYAEPGFGIIGQEGIELYYDSYLRGLAGSIAAKTDRRGNEMLYGRVNYIPAIEGFDVKLTIDIIIQHILEREIENAVALYNPKGIYAIVMEPFTGEILAMANYPDFDPNEPPRNFDNFELMRHSIRNFSVTDNHEPGSIFKIITAAVALEEGVANLDSTYMDQGFRIIDGQIIRCWKEGGHGLQTFSEAFMNSCNPAFMDMALKIGINRFYDHINKFGFGNQTGIDITGEESGILVDRSRVKTVDLARISFGHAIALTPIQFINSVASIINGGNLMKPFIVREISEMQSNDGKSRVILRNSPTIVRRVLSNDVSELMRSVLEEAVTYGSGRQAYIDGYRVGGKTGTAQKYGPTGEILDGKYISSFIGFAPVDKPELLVLFMVDEPDAEVVYGSVIAAPHVGRIIEDALKYLGVKSEVSPESFENQENIVLPDLTGIPIDLAIAKLERLDLNFVTEGEGLLIKSQMPAANNTVSPNTMVLLLLGDDITSKDVIGADAGTVIVPDIRGKTIREASKLISQKGLYMTAEGIGLVYKQEPEAGTLVEPNTAVKATFRIINGID